MDVRSIRETARYNTIALMAATMAAHPRSKLDAVADDIADNAVLLYRAVLVAIRAAEQMGAL